VEDGSRPMEAALNQGRGRPMSGKIDPDRRHFLGTVPMTLAAAQFGMIDSATFERTAASFKNPDHVSIVIHNYRWRLGLADGEPKYTDLEKRLAKFPLITVPTITLEGDANGAPHPEATSYAKKFSGKYSHRIIKGGIGHNLPQEAPQAFAQAIIDVGGY
jgi:pimeloyl-ACP methyl ester carboxylesterase